MPIASGLIFGMRPGVATGPVAVDEKMAPFTYVLYVDTPTSPASPKIASWLSAQPRAAAVDRRAVGEVLRPDAAADAVTRLEDHDRLAVLASAAGPP